MAYTVHSQAGAQPIATTSTVQKHALGSIVRGVDDTLGAGEFIYLLGVVNTLVGSLVVFDATTWQTVLTVGSTHKNSGCPVAVAMSANVAASYGWYQIQGNATILKTAVAVSPQVPVMLSSATAGRVKVLTSAGFMIVGARTANLASVTSTTSTVVVTINAPHVQGQIT